MKKIFLYVEYLKVKSFEKKYLNKVDKIIVLSKEDKKMMKDISNTKENKFKIIPIPVECNYKKTILSKDSIEINIMFLGTLSWHPNNEAIVWFLENVMPKLNKNHKLYIVGKNPTEEVVKLAKSFENVLITGYVEDVNEYIERCDLMIVPIFIGSGLRVKILEGLGKGIPIISTSVGAEGIEIEDRKNIIIADNEEEFIKGIEYLQNEENYKNIQKNGVQLYKENYSIDVLEARINKIFN